MTRKSKEEIEQEKLRSADLDTLVVIDQVTGLRKRARSVLQKLIARHSGGTKGGK